MKYTTRKEAFGLSPRLRGLGILSWLSPGAYTQALRWRLLRRLICWSALILSANF